MTKRYATPDGFTVTQVELSATPEPKRRWDPAKHWGPKNYWRIEVSGSVLGYAPITGPDPVAALREHAAEYGWDVNDLRPIPSHVVIDHYGMVFDRAEDGIPFGREDAIAFAAKRNDGMKPGLENAHRVFGLYEIGNDRVSPAVPKAPVTGLAA